MVAECEIYPGYSTQSLGGQLAAAKVSPVHFNAHQPP